MSAGTSAINIGGSWLYFGGVIYNNVTVNNAAAINVYSGATFNALAFLSTKDVGFEGGKTVAFTTLSIPNGTSCSDLEIGRAHV